ALRAGGTTPSPSGTPMPAAEEARESQWREMRTMTARRDSRVPGSETLDSLLHRVQRARLAGAGVAPRAAAETPVDPIPCPDEGSQVEEEWLREERLSLTEFTRRQFQAIRQQQEHLETQ